jgi:hypothetical protein
MAVTLSIPFNIIKAISLFAAANDIRYYLNGVAICRISDNQLFIVATNGYVMGIYNYDADNCGIEFNAVFDRVKTTVGMNENMPCAIIPIGAIPRKDRENEGVIFENYHGMHMVNGVRTRMIEDAGSFPDFRRLYDNVEPSGVVAQFNPDYLKLFEKAKTILSGNSRLGCFIGHNGEDIAHVAIAADANFIGLIKPIRVDYKPKFIKPWLIVNGAADGK